MTHARPAVVRRRLIPLTLALALGLLLVVVPAGPAQAEDCVWRDGLVIDSGVSRATGDIYRCWSNTYGTYYKTREKLWDTACDDRTAYLDVHGEGQGGHTISVSGCGKSVTWNIYWDPPLYGVKMRTRACNFTCSSEDSDWMYP